MSGGRFVGPRLSVDFQFSQHRRQVPRGRSSSAALSCSSYDRLLGDRPRQRRRPEPERLPKGLILDGELIALGDDGLPNFPSLSERVLHGRKGIAVSYVIFDVLACDGHSVMSSTYSERRRILEELELKYRYGAPTTAPLGRYVVCVTCQRPSPC